MNERENAHLALSAVIITKNEADKISACIESVSFCDEVLVVDSGSTDNTVEISQGMGARVIHQDWLGYGPQKNFAVSQAQFDWVLCIDADEQVSPELHKAVVQALGQTEVSTHAYTFPRCNEFMGRWLRHGEGYPDLSLRLFDRRFAQWGSSLIHEAVEMNSSADSVERLSGDLLHQSCMSIQTYVEKQNAYTTLQAESLAAAGKRASVAKIVLSPLVRFIKMYVFKRGFLDGVPGLVHILIGCMTVFLKYAKLKDMTAARNK